MAVAAAAAAAAAAGGEGEEGDAEELTLAERASLVDEVRRVLSLLRPAAFSASPLSASLSVCSLLDGYQEAAELLDPHLADIVAAVFDSLLPLLSAPPAAACCSPLLHRLLSVLYTAAKVRGHKTVVGFFPHAAWQLEPVLQLLLNQPAEARETWTTPFSLLLWLSILVRLPFDLRSLDSGQHEAETAEAAGGVVAQLVAVGRRYLQDSGPSRDMAALMLSRLLSRPDTQPQLAQHLSWSLSCLQPAEETAAACPPSSSSSFLHCGVLRSLVDVCKSGERAALLPLLSGLLGVPPLLRLLVPAGVRPQRPAA